MPSYASQISVEDRWAVVAYVRALQLSQHAPLAELPADDRERALAAGAPAP
jgi:mono/diheme cytochrome c family protein